MPEISAGLLLYRGQGEGVEVLLVHPGGPLWKNRDLGAWTIPKGLADPGEELLPAARREFAEETGSAAPDADCLALGTVRLKSGKTVHAWAIRGDFDPAALRSNSFEMEWPPRSGRRARFPEVDRAAFFSLELARTKINAAQLPLLDRLARVLESRSHEG